MFDCSVWPIARRILSRPCRDLRPAGLHSGGARTERCSAQSRNRRTRTLVALICPAQTAPSPMWLARSSFKPLPCSGSAMRATGPATGAAFASLEILDRALDPAAARRSLFGRDHPTNPFVPRQRRQMLPSRLRRGFRAKSLAQVRRSFVQRTGVSLVLHNA